MTLHDHDVAIAPWLRLLVFVVVWLVAMLAVGPPLLAAHGDSTTTMVGAMALSAAVAWLASRVVARVAPDETPDQTER